RGNSFTSSIPPSYREDSEYQYDDERSQSTVCACSCCNSLCSKRGVLKLMEVLLALLVLICIAISQATSSGVTSSYSMGMGTDIFNSFDSSPFQGVELELDVCLQRQRLYGGRGQTWVNCQVQGTDGAAAFFIVLLALLYIASAVVAARNLIKVHKGLLLQKILTHYYCRKTFTSWTCKLGKHFGFGIRAKPSSLEDRDSWKSEIMIYTDIAVLGTACIQQRGGPRQLCH
uniref:Uncharacterized protein n=1 Tax=Eptatretus burgeri TaxID=7764 RepID=A0A8C4QHX9_EPTBU